jgi:hypothetical protein
MLSVTLMSDIVVATFVMADPSPVAQWPEFRPPEKGFSVRLPHVPSKAPAFSGEANGRKFEIETYICRFGDRRFALTVADGHDRTEAEPQLEMLKEVLSSEPSKGELIAEVSIEFDGNPGWASTIRMANGYEHRRVYWWGRGSTLSPRPVSVRKWTRSFLTSSDRFTCSRQAVRCCLARAVVGHRSTAAAEWPRDLDGIERK